MCSTLPHRISTPSRLHFTLIDMNGEIGRIDGSLGLATRYPGVSLEFGPHEETVVRGGSSAERELVLAEIAAAGKILGVQPGIEILIHQMIPPHQGLGSGTQTRLALPSALSHRHGLDHSPREIAAMSTRGGTSGIGINAFRCGGILLDGGHSIREQKTSFAPSRFATKAGQPPLLMRDDFPTTWGIALFIPSRHRGLSGQDELDFMLANTPVPLGEVQSTSHIILMRLLPALRVWTCVDALVTQAFSSVGSVRAVRRCRVSGLSMRQVTRPRVLMEIRGPGPYRLRELDGSAVKAGFPDPVSIDRLPLPFLRPARVPDGYPPGRPVRRRREPGNSPSSSPAPRRCAPSGWPAPRRPACVVCAPASWQAMGRSSCRAELPSERPPWLP